jgi:hypothetical protein
MSFLVKYCYPLHNMWEETLCTAIWTACCCSNAGSCPASEGRNAAQQPNVLARYDIAETFPFENLTLSVSQILQLLPAPNATQTLKLSNVRNLCITYQNFDHPPDLESRINASLGEGMWMLNEAEVNMISDAMEENGDDHLNIHACGVLLLFQPVLSKMIGLQTFRLQMELKAASARKTEALYMMTTRAVLLALPASITGLDIDIQGEQPRFCVRAHAPHQAMHVCPILLSGKFVPSLRHLRVRLRQLCPHIFRVNRGSRDHLETLVINTCLTDRYETGSDIERNTCRTRDCATSEDDPTSISRFQERLMIPALRAATHLPSLKTLKIMHPTRVRNNLDLDYDPTIVHLGVTDVLTRGYSTITI